MEYLNDYPLLDKKLASFLTEFSNSGVDLGEITTPVFRNLLADLSAKMMGELVEIKETIEITIETDNFKTPVKLYYPAIEKKLPMVFFIHGGGWVAGDLNSYDNICRRLAHNSGCVVSSVDYTLSPEQVFPYAINQIEEVLNWFILNGGRYNVDINNIILSGDSAGGNFAAILSHRLSNSKTIKLPIGQVLFYPVVDWLSEYKSKKEFGKGFMLDSKLMNFFLKEYTDNKIDKDNPDLSPYYASIGEKFPQTLIITAGHDPLRDEGIEYANKLKENGVNVIHTNYTSMVHGFIGFEPFEPSHLAIKEACLFIKSVVSAVKISTINTSDN